MDKEIPFSVIFLAGGTGARMKATIPKQYLLLLNKPIALYSFEVFLALPEVEEIVVVCEEEYEAVFRPFQNQKRLSFARPGLRRQDSVYNGMQALQSENEDQLICIHDSVRPLIDDSLVRKVVHMANYWEAAVSGVKVKATIKICDGAQIVLNTLDRTHLWEMHTPQVIRYSLLQEGFQQVHQQNITVTDDVALVELVGKPVKVVEGSYNNIKITTPEDLIIVKTILEENALLQTDHLL